MDENEVYIVRKFIQDVIKETKDNKPVGATETARLIILKLDKYRKYKQERENVIKDILDKMKYNK